MNTKLILIEGLPGSGKSTTARYVANVLSEQGIPNQLFDEGQYEESVGLFDPSSPTYVPDVLCQWQTFVDQLISSQSVAVMEAHFWQNTGSYMLNMGYAPRDIVAIIQSISEYLSPLHPTLIYLTLKPNRAHLAKHLTWLYELRGKEWAEVVLARHAKMPYFQQCNQPLFDCRVSFMQDCHALHEELFERFPFRKQKVCEPHQNWKQAYESINEFLGEAVGQQIVDTDGRQHG